MVIDQKLFDSVLESLISETVANHPHPLDQPCLGCKIKDQLIKSQKLKDFCTNAVVVQLIEPDFNPVYAFFEAVLLGIEICHCYKEAEKLEEQFNASPKS